jgi:tRNA threonylcarbamoyladenosine biosynthesis protein TsaE
MQKSIPIANLEETLGFGRALGRLLFPGAVVALVGPLGAGKTHLTRGIAEGLEIQNPLLVNSPTFVLIQEYPARLPIYHFDAYRLQNVASFEDLGTGEYFFGEGVSIVEWADRVEAALPLEHLRIEIVVLDENRRELRCQAQGDRYSVIVDQISLTK